MPCTQALNLRLHPQTLVAVQDLLDSDGSLAAGFARVRFLVLDEADRLLDATFEGPLRTILGTLPPGASRQTLLFRCSLPRPGGVRRLAATGGAAGG